MQRRVSCIGKNEADGRAFSKGGLRPDAPSVLVDDTLNRCKPDARTWKFIGAMKALECAKQSSSVSHIEPYTIVAHVQHGLAAHRFGAKLDARRRLGRGEFPGIVEKIFQNDPQEPCVAAGQNVRRDHELGTPVGSAVL